MNDWIPENRRSVFAVSFERWPQTGTRLGNELWFSVNQENNRSALL